MTNIKNNHLFQLLRAPICIVLAYLMISLNNVVVQMTEVNAYGDVFWRNLVCCLVLIPFMIGRYGYESFYVEKELLLPLILRCITGFLSMFFLFYSLDFVADQDFAAVQILFFVAPVFTALFFSIVFGFRITKLAALTYVTSFIGIAILFSLTRTSSFSASLFALFAAIATSASAIFMVRLRTASSPLALVFYTCLTCCICSAVLQVAVGWQYPTTLKEALLLIASGIQGVLIISLLTLGYRYANDSKIDVLTYSSILFAILSQWLFKGALPSNIMLVVFAVILFSGVLHNHFDRNPR